MTSRAALAFVFRQWRRLSQRGSGSAVGTILLEPLERRELLSSIVMADGDARLAAPAIMVEPTSQAAAASMSLLAQEMFTDIGELSSASPGGFSGIESGTLFKRYGGPSETGGVDGYSADTHNAAVRAYWNLGASSFVTARDSGMISGWFYFNDFVDPQNGDNAAIFLEGRSTPTDLTYFALGVDKDGALRSDAWQTGTADLGITLERYKWYWFSAAWTGNLSQWSVRYYMAEQGDPQPTQIYATATKSNGNNPMDRVYIENRAQGAAARFGGRIGAAQLHAISGFNDVALPANVHLLPEGTRRTWWINPITGSDSNTGSGADAAWRTVDKLQEELTYAGVFGSNEGMDTGDILRIDTRDGPLVMEQNLVLGRNLDGLEITSWNGQDMATLEAFKALDGGFFQPDAANLPNVWATTDTDMHVVMWQDRRWMHHPSGLTFNDVKTTLNQTPGSFWTDGTLLYVHPFDSGDPNSDGSQYERSYTYASNTTGVVELNNRNYHLHHLALGGFSLISSTNMPISRGVLVNGTSSGGTAKVNDVYLYYGGKHLLSWGTTASNSVLTFENIHVEQGPAAEWNVGAGTQTVFVVAPIDGAGTRYTFRNIHSLHNAGKVGSTEGTTDVDQPAFISHNGGYGQQLASLVIEDSSFDAAVDLADNNILPGGLKIRNTQITGGLKVSTWNTRIERSVIAGGLSVTGTGGMIVRDSVLTFAHHFATQVSVAQGSVDIQSSTIDARGTVTPINEPYALFASQGVLWWTFINNVVLFDSGAPFTVVGNLGSDDVIYSDHNVYQLGTEGKLVRSYFGQDRTFAQWQALGFDGNSIAVADAMLDAQWRPLVGSPVIGAAMMRHAAVDRTGRVFAMRGDAGAFEFVTAGDFDGDDQIDATDIDLLHVAIAAANFEPWYDLTGDSLATQADMDMLLHDILKTVRGDVNLDGRVDALDLSVLANNWLTSNKGWRDGDINGDGVINALDLSALAENWGYTSE